MSHLITQNSISRIHDNPKDTSFHPIVQVISIKKIKTNKQTAVDRYRLILSDGVHYQQAMLTTRLNEKIEKNELVKGCIVELSEYVCNLVQDRLIIIVMNAEIKNGAVPRVGTPTNVEKRDKRAAPSSHPVQYHQQQPKQEQNLPPGNTNYNAQQQQQQYAPSKTATSTTTSSRYGNNNGGFGGRYNRSGGGGAVVQSGHSSSSSSDICPINQLNPYRSTWTIKARVTSKSAKKTWENARSAGCLFSVDLLDADGSEIRGTFFKEAVEKFYDMLQEDNVYTFQGGRIKMANRQYTSIDCDYEITFSQYSVIKHLGDDRSIRKMMFNFCPIAQLADTEPGSMIDVIGVVSSDGGMQQIKTKSGRDCVKRDLEIVDHTAHSIRVTLWGERAEKELARYDQAPIMAFKGVKLGDYGGRSIGTYGSSTIVVNPEVAETTKLRVWYDNGGCNSAMKSLSSGGGGRSSKNAQPISDINTLNLGHGEKPDYIDVIGMVMFVKKEKCWYDACPKQRGGRQCNKKVLPCGADDLDGPFRCEACNVEMEQCQRRYILGLNILDHSGQTWATAFNDEGEKLLNGMTADELNLIMQSDHAKFNDILQGIIMKPMQLTLRVKVETVNDEQRVKASIQSSEPIDFVRESKRLLEGIQGLLM